MPRAEKSARARRKKPSPAAAPVRFVVATKNPDKVREIKKLLSSVPVGILPYRGRSPAETGRTLAANAAIKAAAAARSTKEWAVADDTGLEIAALSGRPGVRSARFAGAGCSYDDNVKKVLRLMEVVPPEKRKAVFKTAVCVCSPSGKKYFAEGLCRGGVTSAPRGKNGFGYDPIFYYPPAKKTFAEMTLPEKNAISHRARAFLKAAKIMTRLAGKFSD